MTESNKETIGILSIVVVIVIMVAKFTASNKLVHFLKDFLSVGSSF